MSKEIHAVGGPTDLLKAGGKFATFDPAECTTTTQCKIYDLLKNHTEQLSQWEYSFLVDVWNKEPLTRKQHIKVYRIWQKSQ